ncbi:hypothetical protein KQ298_07285 [Synechococcus sp. CS-1330]|nr:hypothetical protein [Synechococcus sp. CS-1330]
MAIIDINGSLSINLNQTTVDPSAARNIQFTSTSESSLSASLELEVAPGVWKQAFAIYTGNFVYANNALIGGSINGFQTWLADNSLSIQGSSPRFQERCHPFDPSIRGLEDMTNASLQRGR